MKLKKYSIEQHNALAANIKSLNNEMNTILKDIALHYGLNSKELAQVQRTKTQLAVFRSTMDTNAILEYPGTDLKLISYYRGDHD